MLNNLHYSKTFINNYFGTSKDLVHMDGLSPHSIKNLMNEEMYSYEYKVNESNDYFFIIKNHDYSLKELSTYKHLSNYGFNVIYLNFSSINTMGVKESIDLLIWLDYYIKLYPQINIYLLGIKEGSEIITKSLKSLYPTNVKALILDNFSPFRYQHLVKSYARDNGLNYHLFKSLCDLRLSDRFNISSKDLLYQNELRNNKIPVLFIFDKGRSDEEYKEVLKVYNQNPSYKKFFYSSGINDDKYLKTLNVFAKTLNSL